MYKPVLEVFYAQIRPQALFYPASFAVEITLGIMNFDTSSLWHWAFCAVALAMSLFYGWYACQIFEVTASGKPTSWRVHQFWFNFVGAAIGWVAAWALLGAVLSCASGSCTNSVSLSSVALFLVAFLGITGHLPMSLVGLIGGLREFVAKLLSVIGGKP
jgi:hypothetical protein